MFPCEMVKYINTNDAPFRYIWLSYKFILSKIIYNLRQLIFLLKDDSYVWSWYTNCGVLMDFLSCAAPLK